MKEVLQWHFVLGFVAAALLADVGGVRFATGGALFVVAVAALVVFG